MYVVDPTWRSFVEGSENTEFPIQNLPYGVFKDEDHPQGVTGVAIGDKILNLGLLEEKGYFLGTIDHPVFNKTSLNEFMQLGRGSWTKVREIIANLLKEGSELENNSEFSNMVLVDQSEVEMIIPVEVSEFTDFYSSYYHAYNVGSLIRGPKNALMPNWKHLPVAYHGRASSVLISGSDIHRPRGQIKSAESDTPIFSETKRLDFELEMGFFVGTGNEIGHPISIKDARDHIFGMVLVNDWSARDVQVWEYKPLGPFLAKNFATSISPWVVTLDALEPFRTTGMKQDPEPMSYLRSEGKQAYDIDLEVYLQTDSMSEPKQITWSNATNLYWNIVQQLAHHTITGCNVRTGDLMGSGTISGEQLNARGCLLELTELGKNPLQLDGEERVFLEDGDTIVMKAVCKGESYHIGFGEVRTTILPAI